MLPADVILLRQCDFSVMNHLQLPGIVDQFEFVIPILGHQPPKNRKSLQPSPNVWIKRSRPPFPSPDIGASKIERARPIAFDVDENPIEYETFVNGAPHDIEYEIRYITYHEDDDTAVAAQMAGLLPADGFLLTGPLPEQLGPFEFNVDLVTPVPGLKSSEIGGMYRIRARQIYFGEKVINASVPALASQSVDNVINGETI